MRGWHQHITPAACLTRSRTRRRQLAGPPASSEVAQATQVCIACQLLRLLFGRDMHMRATCRMWLPRGWVAHNKPPAAAPASPAAAADLGRPRPAAAAPPACARRRAAPPLGPLRSSTGSPAGSGQQREGEGERRGQVRARSRPGVSQRKWVRPVQTEGGSKRVRRQRDHSRAAQAQPGGHTRWQRRLRELPWPEPEPDLSLRASGASGS